MKSRLLILATRISESHPVLWNAAWKLAHLDPLLPHDRGYLALRPFIREMPDGLILDIGANDGISALGFRKLAPAAPILSIEPNPVHTQALARIAAADPKFQYRIAACGASQGRLDLCMPVYRSIPLHTFCSSSQQGAREQVKAAFGDGVAKQIRISEFSAELLTVDSLGVSPAIMKIDAEGASVQVLQGALETIRKSHPLIVTEIGEDMETVKELLEPLGYVFAMYDVPSDTFDFAMNDATHRVGRRNFFAVHRERAHWLRQAR